MEESDDSMDGYDRQEQNRLNSLGMYALKLSLPYIIDFWTLCGPFQ